MNTAIPAIETRFRGYRFRSRLEARYAVFFEVVGLSYQYEPDKFGTEVGRYIPDFWIPTLDDNGGMYIEVKGQPPDDVAIAKADGLSEATGKSVSIFGPNFEAFTTAPDIRQSFFSQCPVCGHIDVVEHYVDPDDEGGPYPPRHRDHDCWAQGWMAYKCNSEDYFGQDFVASPHSPLLDLGYEAAKSARFEDPNWEKLELSYYLRSSRQLRDWQVYCTGEEARTIALVLARWSKATRFCPRRKERVLASAAQHGYRD